MDYKGGTYQIPTFEEALAEFADEGLVFYAHINGNINQDPKIAARLEELLEQYDAYDNVVFFIGSGEHSLYNPVDETVTGKISFTAGGAHPRHIESFESPQVAKKREAKRLL